MSTVGCPISCGSTSVRRLSVEPYVQCQGCGLVFREGASAAPTAGHALTRETYMRAVRHKLPVNRERVRWLSRHFPMRHGRAADIGTKDGSAMKALIEAGWQVVGYDPDTRFHAFARETYGVDIRPAWFPDAAIVAGSLDLVTAFHVLEHIPEPLPWLRAIRETLQPQGRLYLETPNLRHIQARQFGRGHVVLYTGNTLRRVMEAAGFEVVAMTQCAPGGLRSYDQLAALARPNGGKRVQFGLDAEDDRVPQYIAGARQDPPPSHVLPVRAYRGIKRRVRSVVRRAAYCALR